MLCLAELGGEQRGRAELLHDELGCSRRCHEEEVGVGRSIGLGEAEDEAVFTPHGLDVETSSLDAGCCSHCPGSVDAATEVSEDADAPITELVADTLDDDGAVVGNLVRGELLVGEIVEDVLGGLLVEVVLADEPGDKGGVKPGQWGGVKVGQ